MLLINGCNDALTSTEIPPVGTRARYHIAGNRDHSIATERHTGRSLQLHILRVTSDGFRTPTVAQSEGSAPQINPPSVRQLTPYHFYPVAEKGNSRQNPAGRDFAREQPEFVARNTATLKSAQRKGRTENPIELRS